MDLFETQRRRIQQSQAPLATRMRPRTLEEFLGQNHILGSGRVLRQAIEADRTPSMVLWGPPGSGKTSLAHVIAGGASAHFSSISAVTSGVADLRRAVDEARERLGMHGRRTILFIDEVHRFNKAQQDVILPHVEDGAVIFIGATTENPSFEVIAPLLSRCRVFTLNGLTGDDLRSLVERALADADRGIGGMNAALANDALDMLVTAANGDARIALNALELAVGVTPPGEDGARNVPLATVQDALQQRSLLYDKKGAGHYDTISAFIKSVRGSAPDAAVYWLARMLEAGEDPMFIARRLIILASEDIGLAEPQALPLAVACQQAVHVVGLPEGAIPLAETTVFLATAPKSNSAYMALQAAREDARTTRNDPVPLHIRNAPTPLMKGLGYGEGYKYSHDYEGHFVEQSYLPESIQGKRYYAPSEQGFEQSIAERLRRWWGQQSGGAEEGGR